jgi:ATP-dependent Clp protease ATP-binding subunit ClpA
MTTEAIKLTTQAARFTMTMGIGAITHSMLTRLVNRFATDLLTKSAPLINSAVLLITGVSMISAGQANDINFPILQLMLLSLGYAGVLLITYQSSVKASQKSLTHLPSFMVDMVAEAKEKIRIETARNPHRKFVPMKGYEEAIDQILDQIGCPEQTSLVLVGHAGVGKTRIWERIVDNIANDFYKKDDEAAIFTQYKFVKVEVNSLISDTTLRGQLESRIKAMLDLSKKDSTVIYVIDEIHQLVERSKLDPTNDLAVKFFPAMARGEINIWGACIPADYARCIAKTPLERRMPAIKVAQPTPKECYTMLKHYYAIVDQGNIKVSDDAIQAAILFSGRDITAQSFPDKAIKEIELARSRARRIHRRIKQATTIGVEEIAAVHITKVPNLTIPKLMEQFGIFKRFYAADFLGLN